MPPTGTADASAGDLVAVFIDLENLALGAGETQLCRARPIPSCIRHLELLCRDYGRRNTSIRRAYADWSRPEFAKHQFNLAQNGITLIQVTRFGAQQKNAADILMAVDAMEVLITHPDVGTFMLVAGDGDYLPWSSGCASPASASSASAPSSVGERPGWSRSGSEYKYWGTIVAAVNPDVRAEVGAKFDIADVERLITEAMEESPDASATGSWLKSKMLALDPAFDEQNYGSKSFRVLLSRLPNLVEVKKDRSSSDMLVSLVAPRQAKAATREAKPAPRDAKDAPREAKTAPRQGKAGSREAKAPRQAKAAPRKAKEVPREAKSAPRQAKAGSRETKAPGQAQAAPRQAQAAPREAKEVPRQSENT